MFVKVKDVTLGWNDDLAEEEFYVAFEFDLKGDHYEGNYTYCAGNMYESVRQVQVTLDGVDQYAPGHYDAEAQEWVEFTGTYLSRVVPEDYWDEDFIYSVLNPIWEARQKATEAAMEAAKGTDVVLGTASDEEV
jgi:hypothetical protein